MRRKRASAGKRGGDALSSSCVLLFDMQGDVFSVAQGCSSRRVYEADEGGCKQGRPDGGRIVCLSVPNVFRGKRSSLLLVGSTLPMRYDGLHSLMRRAWELLTGRAGRYCRLHLPSSHTKPTTAQPLKRVSHPMRTVGHPSLTCVRLDQRLHVLRCDIGEGAAHPCSGGRDAKGWTGKCRVRREWDAGIAAKHFHRSTPHWQRSALRPAGMLPNPDPPTCDERRQHARVQLAAVLRMLHLLAVLLRLVPVTLLGFLGLLGLVGRLLFLLLGQLQGRWGASGGFRVGVCGRGVGRGLEVAPSATAQKQPFLPPKAAAHRALVFTGPRPRMHAEPVKPAHPLPPICSATHAPPAATSRHKFAMEACAHRATPLLASPYNKC